ncbi:LOW QUALITY PROTEIN: hypothetical protein BC938DRAFT_479312 [Jimgerdemannia flammicorona]|uniref:RRM domain-containing protein n=1 Tax=Jimgerdemannia flammicorona TaxID=994334 RepID=A0A433QL58_9FUNG|nr:LOW QUALITY PROTEIN: hypothetical protein BC938DRAFT_479312 [Jimgerdemannia flammicorona]
MLRAAFERYGAINDAKVIRNFDYVWATYPDPLTVAVTGDSRGYAFIEFTHERSAQDAFRSANKTIIDGREILIDYERSRIMSGWVPRRLGGGFGGRKESGQLRFGARDRPFKKPFIWMRIVFGGITFLKCGSLVGIFLTSAHY